MEIIRKGTFSRCTLKKLSQHVFCLAENLCFIKEDMQTLRITENYPQKTPNQSTACHYMLSRFMSGAL